MAVQDYKPSHSGRLNICNVLCFSYKYMELWSSFCNLRDAERYRPYHIVHPAAYSSLHCDVFEYLNASLDFEESEHSVNK